MRALSLVLLSSGCSLLFDGSDLHGVRAPNGDMSRVTMTSDDLAGAPPSDLAGVAAGDMRHTLAFATAQTYSMNAHGTDLAVGHFSGGAQLDIAAISHAANLVYVLANAGNGTFGGLTSHAACVSATGPASKPYNLVAADFDGDTHDDVAYTCNDTAAGQDRVGVLLGDGAGGLTKMGGTIFNVGTAHAATASGNVFNAVGLAAGDFNADGKRDLLVGFNQDEECDLFTGSGSNPVTFSAPIAQTLATGSQTAGIAADDLNGDGATDAVLSNSDGAVVLIANKPLGVKPFKATTYFPSPMYDGAGTVAFGALTAGGKPDLLVVLFDAVAMEPGNAIQILRNDGDGLFPGTPATIPSDANTTYIVTADLDGDGRPDIVYNAPDLGRVGVALQNGDGTFQAAVTFTVPTGVNGLVARDLDGDGRIDLAVVSNTGMGVSVLINESS